ncbi:MAG TPA: hypothetical protein VG757_03705 [Devosia sp.]|nr:hypothetical protein [Devosia sp.]
MRSFDFSSWQSILVTLVGLALFTLIGIGIRLLVMQTIQQRQQRLNRQINERLRTLIAAYKVLGGSFTGNLSVDPTHLRELHRAAAEDGDSDNPTDDGSDRKRRMRDAVEAALSDIILLGTEDQVRLAANAAGEMVAGRPVETRDLVVSLRNFIRDALDLAPIPATLAIPTQGPTRPSSTSGRGKGGEGRGSDAGGNRGSGGGTGAAGGMGMGGGMGLGMGLGRGGSDDPDDPDRSGA